MNDMQIYKIKLKLKQWEVDFQEKNGRKPKKDDIAAATPDVREMYLRYAVVKKQVMADCISSDGGCKVAQDSKLSFWSDDLNKEISNKKLTAKLSTSWSGKYVQKLQANNVALVHKKCDYSSTRTSASNHCHKDCGNVDSNNEALVPENENLSDGPHDVSFKRHFKVNSKMENSEGRRHVKAVNVFTGADLKLPSCRKVPIHDELGMNAAAVAMDKCESLCETRESVAGGPMPRRIGIGSSCDGGIHHNDIIEGVVGHIAKNLTCTDNGFGFIPVKMQTDEANGVVTLSNSTCFNEFSEKNFEKTEILNGSLEYTLECKEPIQLSRSTTICNEGTSKRDTSGKRKGSISLAKGTNQPSKKLRSSDTSRAAPNSNYVRLNMKKRVYSRGKKHFNFRRFKYGRWKQLQHEKRPFEECTTLKSESVDDDSSNESDQASQRLFVEQNEVILTPTVNENRNLLEDRALEMVTFPLVEPMFELINDDLPKSAMMDVHQTLKLFGHAQFRNWQLKAIARVLAGKSTLVVQPTGSGKSLSYLLPAYMYSQRSSCITLVISPLVALMQDQVTQVPSCLKAACLHSNMTDHQREKVKESITRGCVDVLFLSPEGLVAGAGSSYGYLPLVLPPVAFVCIDEVHCISAWSHNFRPTYLRLCRVIRENMKVRCVLGLTATATKTTIENVAHHLGVAVNSQSVIRGTLLPSNLCLTISRDQGEEALVTLLKGEPFIQCQSIIIYCIRRDQTERLAMLLRTCFQKENWSAEAYHAGLTASRRRTIQNQFMTGQLKVVVATIAFGMGINKSDVRAVIHYNMPKSIESYVQEIGRAGRDGQPSYCHVFLDMNGEDRQELRRHIYSDTVDRAALAKLLKWIFIRCKCHTLREMERMVDVCSGNSVDASSEVNETWKCPGHEVAFPMDAAVEEIDMKVEAIETLLHYLEMNSDHLVKLLNPIYDTCTIFCYGGAGQMRNVFTKWPLIATMVSKKKMQHKVCAGNTVEFSLVKLASLMGCKVSFLKKQIRQLQWDEVKGPDGEPKYVKSGIVVSFKDLSFHLKAAGDVSDDQIDCILNTLHEIVLKKEKTELKKLDNFYSILHMTSLAHHWDCKEVVSASKSATLKDEIMAYFNNALCPSSFVSSLSIQKQVDGVEVEKVSASILRFLSIYGSDNRFTGRNVARIFHGIGSPQYPAETWGKVRQFWRSHLDFDFNLLCKMATEHLLQVRSN